MNELWVDKYAPKSLDDYVFKDASQKKIIEKWIADGALPTVGLWGPAGVGKSSLINLMLHLLNVEEFDVLRINASNNNGIDYVRNTIINFVERLGLGQYRYVFLDEADGLTPNAQQILRGLIEQYSKTARFLFTANYQNKILPALHSRCQGFTINKLDRDEFTLKLANILMSENIEIDESSLTILNEIIDKNYPDMRKSIMSLQQNCNGNKLLKPDADSTNSSDYVIEMIALFKRKKYKEARDLICAKIGLEEYDDIFRFMYKNLDIWADNYQKQSKCILAIRDGLVKHTLVADPEINLSATLITLEQIANG